MEVEAIFLMSHQQSQKGAWKVAITSSRHAAHGSVCVEEVSVSLQDDPCRVSLMISMTMLALDTMAAAAWCIGKRSAAANVTDLGVVLSRVYVSKRAESYIVIKVHSSIDSTWLLLPLMPRVLCLLSLHRIKTDTLLGHCQWLALEAKIYRKVRADSSSQSYKIHICQKHQFLCVKQPLRTKLETAYPKEIDSFAA